MARHSDRERVEDIFAYVGKNPGARPADIARDLKLERSTVSRALPALEDEGRLLYEDRRGGLWPFRR